MWNDRKIPQVQLWVTPMEIRQGGDFSSIMMGSPSFHRHLEMQKQPITTTPVALANSSKWITRRQAPWEGKWEQGEGAGCTQTSTGCRRVFIALARISPKMEIGHKKITGFNLLKSAGMEILVHPRWVLRCGYTWAAFKPAALFLILMSKF